MRAQTVIGVYDWERKAPQTVLLDLEIGIPSEVPCHTDDIGDTIHYAVVAERVREVLALQHFLLVEALAEFIARFIRDEFGAPWVKVAVTKPGILPEVRAVGVQIERGHRPR
ncbi:7,8-dihydroneopterin aldolase [Paludibacterium paludis]|uniref:Dihydroneopterin aldolase n=2 Tax=Paludibacterium paludis TaxID=1225769 RepID=A0A918UBY4_9NEIS|nr:7,8-dihydroneopterin aldolase [Paludibacterium paludis]